MAVEVEDVVRVVEVAVAVVEAVELAVVNVGDVAVEEAELLL